MNKYESSKRLKEKFSRLGYKLYLFDDMAKATMIFEGVEHVLEIDRSFGFDEYFYLNNQKCVSAITPDVAEAILEIYKHWSKYCSDREA